MSQTKSQLINPIDGNINVTGIVTASQFFGSGTGLTGVASTDNIKTSTPARFLSNISVSGVSTLGNTVVGGATTQLIVNGDTRITGILTISNVSEKINNLGNTGTSATINLNNGNFVTATLNENCTFTFTNPASEASSFTLLLTNDGTSGRTITWPASVVWPGGTIPNRTTAANKTDIYVFFTVNSGTKWYGNLAQYNYA